MGILQPSREACDGVRRDSFSRGLAGGRGLSWHVDYRGTYPFYHEAATITLSKHAHASRWKLPSVE